MSCTSKFYDLIAFAVKIFLLGIFCGFFKLILQSSEVPPYFFIFDILPLPLLTHFTGCFLFDLWHSYCPLNFPNQITHSTKTCFLILFPCTSTVTLKYSIALSVSSKISCTFCYFAYKFSRSHCGFPFWNFIIFLYLVQIFATNNFWSE